MRIASATFMYFYDVNGLNQRILVEPDRIGELAVHMNSHKYAYAITITDFDGFNIFCKEGKVIAARYINYARERGVSPEPKGMRLTAEALGFGKNNRPMLKQLGIFELPTADREEVTRYAYGEVAKLAMERMDRMILGKEK